MFALLLDLCSTLVVVRLTVLLWVFVGRCCGGGRHDRADRFGDGDGVCVCALVLKLSTRTLGALWPCFWC